MAKKTRKKVILPLNTEENKDNRSIGAELAVHEEKQELLNQIAMLKTYISVLENRLQTPKFGQLQLPRKLYSKAATTRGVLDVGTILRHDLYRFSGMQCVKCKDSFVFEMSGTNDVSSNDPYAVEILIDDDGRGKLGKWILPMTVDVQNIISRHPIDNLNNIKQFLKSCKHHVDCYVCRAKQLEELRNFLAEIKNTRVFHTVGITQVELVMSGVKDIENDKVHNVTLYLCYNSAEVRPCKLLSDTDDKEKPSANLLKRLSKYFKLFLKDDLSSAFKRVNESQTDFFWKPITTKENENSGVSDKSLEEAGFLSVHLHRDKKKPEKNEQGKRSTLQNNEMSLHIESEQREDADVKEDKMRKGKQFSAEDKRIKSRKRERSVKTAVKLKKESLDDLRETGSEVANIEEEGHVAGKGNNKSEPKVRSAASRDVNNRENVKRIRRRKQSRECQPDTENTQNADHNILPKDKNNHGDKKVLSPREAASKSQGQKLAKSSDTDSENMKSPLRVRKQRKAGTSIDGKDKEDRTISNQDEQSKQAPIDMSNSTPFTKKLPDKRKFFHASHISEIL